MSYQRSFAGRHASLPIPEEILHLNKVPEWFQDRLQIILDPEIWPLVRVLNVKGIPTHASCPGNYKTHGLDYICPWVNIERGVHAERIDGLGQVLQQYNSKNKIPWSLREDKVGPDQESGYYFLYPSQEAPLIELQETVITLSEYINYHLLEIGANNQLQK